MKKIVKIFYGIVGIYLILLIPLPSRHVEFSTPREQSFQWNMDAFWLSLESAFLEAKKLPHYELDSIVGAQMNIADNLLKEFEGSQISPQDEILRKIELKFFEISPLIAAQQHKSDWYINFYNRVRKKIKSDASQWDLTKVEDRKLIYRILYGMRAVAEEILLQSDHEDFITTMHVTDEPSSTPFIDMLGIKVHSGDLLISRGGAEVSAFISRGNDYPGNFSHVAMIHIDEHSNEPYFVEAHIEKGVAIASIEEYLRDKKLRFMVMRPRFDLSVMQSNPQLPQEASKFIFEEAQNRHIPYDFTMNYYDASQMFCSEVGSYAYKQFGLDLWEFESTISSPGIINWLHAFGVENFVTQMPSDLEYDPMLSVVAEWRNKETLFQDHLDNAITDALIAKANEGLKLKYSPWLLPLGRVLKGYSLMQNLFGGDGVIPKGMSVDSALKNRNFVNNFQHCKKATLEKVEAFKETNGYLPPYWQLVRMANESLTF